MDRESKASSASFKLTQASYNYVQNLSKTYVLTLKRDGEILLHAPEKCATLWNDIRKKDLTTGGTPSLKMMEEIFEKDYEMVKFIFFLPKLMEILKIDKFAEFLKIRTIDDFFETFDEDNDGYLNEDEQILIFSTIKEKMQRVATELCKIQEYELFKALMKEVRKMELDITKYQDFLRKNIHKKELNIYYKIGEERLDDFYEKYDTAFKKLNEYKRDKLHQLRFQHMEEKEKLEEKLGKAVHLIKFKPKKKLKEFQIQEKLVSVDERVEEAINFRKELKDLEVSEKVRVESLQIEAADKQRKELQQKQDKEVKQMKTKLQNDEHKLIINMKKEFDVLQKKIHLHENEIKRIQGLASKYAVKKGKFEGELKRRKYRSIEQNAIIKQSKKIESSFVQSGSKESPEKSPRNTFIGNNNNNFNDNASNSNFGGTATLKRSKTHAYTMFGEQKNATVTTLKSMINTGNISRFYIKQKFGADLPVNRIPSIQTKEEGDGNNKIEKFLKAKKKNKLEILPSLTDLYDNNMVLKKEKNDKTDEVSEIERKKKKNFIDQIINGDRKI